MLEYIKVTTYEGFFGIDVKVWVEDDAVHYSVKDIENGIEIKDKVSSIKCEELDAKLNKVNLKAWAKHYEPLDVIVLDGSTWSIKYKATDSKIIRTSGENAWPNEWYLLLKVLQSATGGKDYFNNIEY